MFTSKKFPYVTLIFFLGMFGVALPYVTYDNIPGDTGDARFNLYILEHFFLALTNQVESFVDAPFFFPISKTVLFSENHWGSGLIYAFFRLQKFGPESAYCGWFIVGFICNYWSAFYVYRKLELKKIAAAMAAFLFTFSLPVLAQDGHAQLIFRAFVPLAFLTFYFYLQSKDLRFAAATFLLLSLQLLVSAYSGIFLIFLLLAFLAAEFLTNSKANILPKKFSWKISLPIFSIASALFLLFALPYLETRNLYQLGHSSSETSSMLPRIQSYFFTKASYFWPETAEVFSSIPTPWEHQMFIGIGAVLCLLILFLRKDFLVAKNPLATKFGYSLILIIAFTSFVGCISFYPLLTMLPGISAIRAVSREIMVLLFPIGFLVGLSLDKIHETNFKNISSSALISILCFLIISDSILAKKSISSEKLWQERLNILEQKLPANLDESSILASRSKLTAEDNLDAMLLSQKLGIKTINGYSGNFVGDYFEIDSCEAAGRRIDQLEKIAQEKGQKDFSFNRDKIVFVGFEADCRRVVK